MKKIRDIFRKRGFGKGSFGGKDSSGQSIKCIGGAHPRALSPRRWEQSGRSMVEMLAVLAIIGVLSVAALAGLTYAMNKHRANTIYNDVHLLALHVMDTGKDTVPADFYPDSGKTFTLDTTTYADGFVVKVADISEKVCDRIMEVNDPSIEKIYVGSEETTNCSGAQDMGFMFLYDGAFTSGSTSGGSGTDPVDPCEGIIASTDCSISADETDSNGCVTVKKITCTGDTYCSGTTCEPCPVAETCAGESCCALTGPNDVCGRPTKEVGTITTVTHSDLNANGCCETTTEESCSLNSVTPRTCTPTCDGTCQSDGSCRPNCETGYCYNETAGQCCADLTETDCQKLVPASSGVCPYLEHVSTEGFPCTTTDGQSGTCQSGVCEAAVTASCDGGTTVTGNNGHEYCMSNDTMTLSDANTWCEERGRHLASMDEACPDTGSNNSWDVLWDASIGEGKCVNLSSLGASAWTPTSADEICDCVWYLIGNEGTTIFTFTGRTHDNRAFCY